MIGCFFIYVKHFLMINLPICDNAMILSFVGTRHASSEWQFDANYQTGNQSSMSRNAREFASDQPVALVMRIARFGYFVSLLLLIAGIFLEVFFAGEIMLVNASALIQHRQLGELLSLVPIVILVTAFLSRFPRHLLIWSLVPAVLMSLQYIFLYGIDNFSLPLDLKALHAVNALVMFWVAQYLARIAWKLLRNS
jgi:hypothetical protein